MQSQTNQVQYLKFGSGFTDIIDPSVIRVTRAVNISPSMLPENF